MVSLQLIGLPGTSPGKVLSNRLGRLKRHNLALCQFSQSHTTALAAAVDPLSDNDVEFFAHFHAETHDSGDRNQRQADNQGGEGEANLAQHELAPPAIVEQAGKDHDPCGRPDDARGQPTESQKPAEPPET